MAEADFDPRYLHLKEGAGAVASEPATVTT